MAQKLDLGQSALRIRDSNLQLHLAASAHFNQRLSHGAPQIPIDLSGSPNLESVWITEAPELELRFFIGGNWDQNEKAAFVSKLRGKLCDMKIWSDLGFSVELKTGALENCIDASAFHCLKLGLCRGCRVQNLTTGWTLPSSMTNPPDARPPPGVPVATLASIDVRLEYRFEAKDKLQAQNCSKLEVGLLGHASWDFPGHQLLGTMAELPILQQVHNEGPYETLESQSSCISGGRSNPSHEELFRLFDLGIQRLLISNFIKDPTIRVPQQATIKSFADISPAVFNPGYRDAINQRALTIPIITKAISSMLAGNKDPSTNAKLADLLGLTHSQGTDGFTTQPQVSGCRAAILSSLWRIAQKNMPKIKTIKRRASMLPTEHVSNRQAGSNDSVRHMSTNQVQFENGNPGLPQSFETQDHDQNEESDMCLLNSESDDQLLDNFSETSFTDIGESTQTSLNTLLSTIGSSQTSYGDHDTMLLLDHGQLADYPGNYGTDYDPGEDMDNTDIIMADDL